MAQNEGNNRARNEMLRKVLDAQRRKHLGDAIYTYLIHVGVAKSKKIARNVKAADRAVRSVLVADGRFETTSPPPGESTRAKWWQIKYRPRESVLKARSRFYD